MSDQLTNGQRDPLIHGPSFVSEVGPSLPSHKISVIEKPLWNVDDTNPLQDLVCLLFRPRLFFQSLLKRRSFSLWAWSKVLFYAVLSKVLVTALEGQQIFVELYRSIEQLMDDPSLPYFFSLGVEDILWLKKAILGFFYLLNQLQLSLGPMTLLPELSLKAVLAYAILRAFQVELSLRRLFFVLLCVQSYSALIIVPGLGPLLAFIYVGFVGLWALRWSLSIQISLAILALHGPTLLQMMFYLMIAITFSGIFYNLL